LIIYIINAKAILISVVELNRHGARTPKKFTEKQKVLFFGSQNMQLTINGFHQEQNLGLHIRERYINNLKFLSPKYNPEEFTIISSPTQRTVFSAAAFLTGLYPDYTVKNFFLKTPNETGELESLRTSFLEKNISFLKPNMLTKRKKDKPYSNPNSNLSQILNLKNEDNYPTLKHFSQIKITDTTTNPIDFEKKEIPLYIANPTYDRLFHPWNCLFNGSKLGKNFKGLNPIFDISKNEINSALLEFKNFLNFSDEDLDKEFTDNNEKLFALIKFYLSINYHFKSDKIISEESLKIFKKIVINDWYSILNSENKEEIKIGISEFFDSILTQFKNAIDYHNGLISGKIDKNDKNKLKKYKVFSGHDTIIVNMLNHILNPVYIKENLKKSLIVHMCIFGVLYQSFGNVLVIGIVP